MGRKRKEEEVIDNDEPTAAEIEAKPSTMMDVSPPPVTQESGDFIDQDEPIATASAAPPVNPGAESVRGTMSASGESYDPAVHSYPPRQVKNGSWKKRRVTGGSTTSEPVTVDDLPNANYRREAEKAAALYASLHTVALGSVAKPDGEDLSPMVDAWESYFQTNGLKKVPPWMQIALTHAAYTHTIVSRPAIWPRVKQGGIRFLRWIGIKVKDKSEKVEHAHPDSGQQPKRQDYTGQDSGAV